jgi:hypothetical protein
LGIDDPEVLAGCVGKGHATAYLAFRRLINELPDVDAIILSPDSAPVPSEPSARWLVSMALAGRMTAGNFGQCLEYLKRMPQTFRALSVLSAFKAEKERRDMGGLKQDHRPLSSSRDFTAWSVSEDGKEIRTSANT